MHDLGTLLSVILAVTILGVASWPALVLVVYVANWSALLGVLLVLAWFTTYSWAFFKLTDWFDRVLRRLS